jgi:hypothetical protein
LASKRTKAEREREHRARENAKKREAKRLIEEPKASDHEQRGTQEQNTVSIATTENISGKQPSKKGGEKADATNHKTKGSSKIVGLLVTKRDAIVAFLDRHGVSVSAIGTAVGALGTVTIVVLTFFYVSYSKQQWQTMQRQLTDYETREGADLVVKIDVAVTSPQYPVLVKGKFTVTNTGSSVAREIYFQSTQWVTTIKPEVNSIRAIPPITLPSGASLAPNDVPLEYPIGMQVGDPDGVEESKVFVGFEAWVGYKTIFGIAKITQACFMYYPQPGKFLPCPTAPQIERQK